MASHTAYIGLGSNLGNRQEYINNALKQLGQTDNIELVRASDFLETTALAKTKQPAYINSVAEIETSLNPHELLKVLWKIENSLGRERKEKWAPRTIDLDILFFDDEVINTSELTVPHSQMHLRSFVLKGLCQLNKQLIHPVLKVSMGNLAARLNGGDFALDEDKPQIISIAGNIGVGKTTLAKKLAEYLSCEILFEPYEDNPFLPEVYAGKHELALDSQLFFLTKRIEQLEADNLSSGQIYISDYVFQKEIIYAKTILDQKQISLYGNIYTKLEQNVCMPTLVIYMRDTAQNCLERIHSRNRPYEQRIELSFLKELEEEYKHLFNNWFHCPVIRISPLELDYSDQTCIEKLLKQIECYISLNKNECIRNN